MPPELAATTEEHLACPPGEKPPTFDRYALGESFEGLPLTHILRRCDIPDESDGRANFVSYIYGTCDIPEDPLTETSASCMFPLELQSWPACERSREGYELGPGLGPLPREDLTIRGIPASIYDDGYRLELYIGATTVVIFGDFPDQIRRAAEAVAAVPSSTPLDAVPSVGAASEELPLPVPGALTDQLPCV